MRKANFGEKQKNLGTKFDFFIEFQENTYLNSLNKLIEATDGADVFSKYYLKVLYIHTCY